MWRWIFGLVFGLLVVVGSVGGEEGVDPEAQRSLEIMQTLAESGEFSSEVELFDAWIEALQKEFVDDAQQVLLGMHIAGDFFYQKGRYQESLKYFEWRVDFSSKSLGSDHHSTLAARNNLAQVLQKLGRLEQAFHIEEQLFEDHVRILGERHPDTLTVKANLASTIKALGDLARARELQEQVLEDRTRILGEQHPDTIRAKANLASTIKALGDLARARELQEQVLEDSTRILGEQHPDTIRAKANLAGTIYALGDLARARELQEQVLEDSTRILGEQHPDTIRAKANLASTIKALGDLARARELQEQVLEDSTRILGEQHPDTIRAKANLASTIYALGDLARARELQEQVLEDSTRILGEQHPDTIRAKANLASTIYALGDLARARELQEQVLEDRTRILGEQHPDTIRAKANLASTIYALGDLARAREYEEQVLEDSTRILGEQHPDTITAKANLAGTIKALGDLARAREYEEQVLEDSTRILGEQHPDTIRAKANLAGTIYALGDLARARELQEQVLEDSTRILGEQHPDTIRAKANLASTIKALGDLARARELQEQVLEDSTRILGEQHPDTIRAKANLASTIKALGDLARARELQEQVLEDSTRILGEQHPDTIRAKANLASTIKALGDLARARELQEQVLEDSTRILGEQHPDTLISMHNLAGTLRDLGQLEKAQNLYKRLLQNRKHALGPEYEENTEFEANNFFSLASTQRDLGNIAEAHTSFLKGLDALEAQALRADASESLKARFKTKYGGSYRDAIATGLALEKTSEALQILERYRTESLLNQLRWSHPNAVEKIPEEYRQELATIAHRYDQITRQLDRLYPQTDPNLQTEQADLRRRREVIQGKIIEARRAETPHQPLSLPKIREHLDPGTLLLAYSIGEESHLFTLTKEGPLQVHPIETEALRLWLQVRRLRDFDLGIEDDLEGRNAITHWFYQKLLQPVSGRIAKAERLLILPDGILNYLHFPALTRSLKTDPRGWQYLVEWKPIHTVQSATVYAELQDRRPKTPTNPGETQLRWTGFGNPVYSAESQPNKQNTIPGREATLSHLRTVKERGIWNGLTELPNTKREIETIANLYPEGTAKPYLLNQATEDQARKILGKTKIAHFAAHGVADPEYPLDSFLALSLLENQDLQHNGLLQAWEVIENLQLNADLVVLSACTTAIGPNQGGEGLISLSRAFQIAGARSVLASLWAVNDASTAELMIRFYKHLLAGKTKDQALRAAQMEFIEGPIQVPNQHGKLVERDFSAPKHWAAFQLIGDWQ